MNPLIMALLVFSYGLAVPTGFRLHRIVQAQHSLAFAGHQFGMCVAALAWALKLSPVLVVLHLLWVIATRVWYWFGSRNQ